jgi:alpha-L-fucosidase
MRFLLYLLAAVFCFPALCVCGALPALIPVPQQMELRQGAFTLDAKTQIVAPAAQKDIAEGLAGHLRAATGYPFRCSYKVSDASGTHAVVFVLNAGQAGLGEEGYELSVRPERIEIRAGAAAGLFYGAQTLLQLLPTAAFSVQLVPGVEWKVPCLEIRDWPRFKWRGLMLDTSRHFFTKPEVERLLDEMALHKLNTFHWHLVDDHGWRVEIKKYPKLTQAGAWREAIGFGLEPKASSAWNRQGQYGGFYSQKDIREVVEYAAARHITIVPEIEMPGHSSAALSAYPELGCTGGPYEPQLIGGVFNGIYCAGREETFQFLEAVLTEVMDLFPGQYIHVGGDEVPKESWKACPRCQARMKTEKLKDEEELQSYLIRRMERVINARGRSLIGWSEILQGGLARNAAVMDWIGGGVEAAKAGHDAVMTPIEFCYLDHYQSRNQAAEPFSIGGFLPLEKVYNYEPMPRDLPAALQGHILGVQGNLWTEYIPNFRQVEYMMFPRACALAEVGWSAQKQRDWGQFQQRLSAHQERLAAMGVHVRQEEPPAATNQPTAFGAVPSPRQLGWHELEYYGFLHFSVNTFTDREWGYGDESETVFNPTDFDAEQIVRTASEAGMRGLILTCKHHDGFCLWPSKYTEHSVKSSPWKAGRGDVVKEVSEACRRHGLRFGVYLSPWDRNRADYGSPAYIEYYRNQIRELLTEYGPIFEIWFDGANGGDGFYGGAREKRVIDRKTYYGWPETCQLVRALQPGTCIWSDAGPDARWVGNESGEAGETCWATLNGADFAPGEADMKRLNSGDLRGTNWIPAECDVSIRPGWFYHAKEDGRVRTADNLLDLYFKSVGRGASLLLNVPPDRRGQIHDADARALLEFRKLLEATFARDLARLAWLSASNVRGRDAHFAPEKVLDDRRYTFWTTDDGVTNAELVLEFRKPVTFQIARLREHLPLGQRVEAFALDQWKGGRWEEFKGATSIGNCRLLRFAPVTTQKVRLRILKSAAPPAIAELGLF